MKITTPRLPSCDDLEKYWRFNVTATSMPEKGMMDSVKSFVGSEKPLPADVLLTLDDFNNMDQYVKWTEKWLAGQAKNVAKVLGEVEADYP